MTYRIETNEGPYLLHEEGTIVQGITTWDVVWPWNCNSPLYKWEVPTNMPPGAEAFHKMNLRQGYSGVGEL
jgi:hypothetical protein